VTSYLLERALLPHGVADDVLVRVVDGRFAEVSVSPDIRGNLRLSGTATPDNRQNPRISGETVTRLNTG